MRKKFLSLFLALALCLGLTVPALADVEGNNSARIAMAERDVSISESSSGNGWSYNADTYTLTLSGYVAQSLYVYNTDKPFTIELAEGTSNTLTNIGTALGIHSASGMTIKGGGTLILTGNLDIADALTIEGGTIVIEGRAELNNSVLHVNGGSVTAKCGLTSVSPTPIENMCTVTGGELVLGDAGFSGVSLELNNNGSGKALGLESACAVGADGQALTLEVYNTYYHTYVDNSGNAVNYVKITAGSSASTPTTTGTQTTTTSAFTDVTASAYYASPVNWAVTQGITNGTSATTFSPETTCTRGQIITFLYRAAGSPAVAGTSSVSDAGDTYYTNAVLWAAENGLFSGSTFSPEAPCTREMAVEFMWKYAGSPDAAAASFTDVSSDAVNWAVSAGVTNGTSATTFSPDTTCTRGQIVTFLYRAFA